MNKSLWPTSLILLAVVFTLHLFVISAGAFSIPERLEFEISYLGIPAGHAVQQVTRESGEIRIVSTARSADWLKLFFPVDDRIESVLVQAPSLKIGVPRLYRERIREGWTRFHKDAVFNRQTMEVTTSDHLKKNVTVQKFSPLTYDTLSSFFYFRSVELKVGTSSFIDIFDCKRIWNTEVQILRREELKTSLGSFKTVVVKPILKSAGIFARTGEMHIWLTDDERRIPLMMKSKVKIGSIKATLVGGSYWPKKQ